MAVFLAMADWVTLGAFTGIWPKFGLPSRLTRVSRQEKLRPCSRGSWVRSMPGITLPVQKATCSVSEKKLSTTRFRVRVPMILTGHSSSGICLAWVPHIERKAVTAGLIEQLYAQIQFRKITPVGCGPHVAAVAVRGGAVAFDRLVPNQRMQAHLRRPVVLDKDAVALGTDKAEGAGAKPPHRGEGSR